MEKQILDLLMKMDERLSNIEQEQKEMKIDIQNMKKDINDRFDIVNMKLNEIEIRVIKLDRKVESTTNQVARNMEVVEDIKLKLQ